MDYRVYEVNTDENGNVLSARCVLENGFQYAIISFPIGALMAVMDYRRGESMPVGIIATFPKAPIEYVEKIINDIIHLYKSHQVITLSSTVDEFYSVFAKIA